MNLYLLTQNENSDYDTFDSIVVCAPSKEAAVKIHPRGGRNGSSTWASSPAAVTCTLIGKAAKTVKPGVVHASFMAG